MQHTIAHIATRQGEPGSPAHRRAGAGARAAVLVAGLVGAAAAQGQGGDLRMPQASRNLSPVYASLGVPVMRGAQAVDAGEWRVGWQFHWASHSLQESAGGRDLEYDGETQRHDLRLSAGLGHGFSFSLNLPWVRHSGGSLDSLIDGWHDFWGMPDGARPEQPRDRLLFGYNGAPGFLLTDAASGIGDAELGLDFAFARRDRWTMSAFAQLKIDSGDAADFTGSGDRGASIGLRFSSPHCVWESVSCHVQVAISDVGELPWDPAADEQVLSGGVALAWEFARGVALFGQVDFHEAVYRSDPLGDAGAPLWGTLGMRWEFAPGWVVDGAFSEDLAVGTAPDVSFLLGLHRRF